MMNTHRSIARIPKVSSSAAEVSGSSEASTGAATLSARMVTPVPPEPGEEEPYAPGESREIGLDKEVGGDEGVGVSATVKYPYHREED